MADNTLTPLGTCLPTGITFATVVNPGLSLSTFSLPPTIGPVATSTTTPPTQAAPASTKGTAQPIHNSSSAASRAQTQKTLDILDRTKPSLVAKLRPIFLGTGSNSLSGTLNTYEYNLTHGILALEINAAQTTNTIVSAINTSIQSGVNSIVQSLNQSKKEIHDNLKPVSKTIGGTFGTFSQMLSSPTGVPEFLGRQMGQLIKDINPNFYNKMDATFKKNKVDDIKNLPGQVMGSIRSIINAFDAILSLPAVIISDVYNGLQDIMRQISSVIDQLEAAVQSYIFGKDGLLDTLVDYDQFGEFLSVVTELAGYATGISQTFAGASSIANTSLQVTSYVNQAVGFINNPLNLAFAYAPPQVSQTLYAINNPQNIINSLLPPQLSQGFAKISQMAGFGFNGNMGFGLASVLQGAQGGILSSILTNYSKQYAILTPLLTLTPGVSTVTYNSNFIAAYKPSVINPAITVTQQGMPVSPFSVPALPIKKIK